MTGDIYLLVFLLLVSRIYVCTVVNVKFMWVLSLNECDDNERRCYSPKGLLPQIYVYAGVLNDGRVMHS